MMMMTLRNIAKIASSRDFTDHTSRFLCGSQKNHVTEMDDLRYQTWLLGAAGRLIFFVSSSQNHGRRLWVSLTYKDQLTDCWTCKSNRTTTPSSFASEPHSSQEGIASPNFDISTSSRGNLAHLRRARWHCKNACTEFRSSRFPLLQKYSVDKKIGFS